ncbi:hypothetical protein AD998_10565 [bacterium 336/3]|nr:hypothetical protein AD998_10565 [bacterium 336/3]
MNSIFTTITKRKLLNDLIENVQIEGQLDIISFLDKIWSLDSISSQDSRFNTARGDIWQHMINNNDFTLRYLYFEYFDLINSYDEIFIKFLETFIHPDVRFDLEDINKNVIRINKHLKGDNYEMAISEMISGYPVYKIRKIAQQLGTKSPKNIIFASNGLKPEIILTDTLDNEIEIVKNGEFCLIYDEQINDFQGLTWKTLIDWWKNKNQGLFDKDIDYERDLYKRLEDSLNENESEKFLFFNYFKVFKDILQEKLPALIPQVYLHYDPKTIKELSGVKRVSQQRIDFLLLLPNNIRIILEIDGKQHYTININSNEVSPKNYAEMVKEDRLLKLKGYEVYRFGGYEFMNSENPKFMIESFFSNLFIKYGLK